MRAAILLCAMVAVSWPQARPGFEQLAKQAAAARDADRDAEAIRLYTQALELRPDWHEGLWYLGTLLYRQESYLEARDVLRRSAALEPGMAPAWALLGMSEYQTREYTRSLAHLMRALTLGLDRGDPLRRSAVYETAALLTRSERYDESLALLMEMAAGEDPSIPLTEAAGLAGLRMPLLPNEIPPDRREMIRLAGAAICQLGAHRRAEAATLMKQLVDGYPAEPGVHFLYGASVLEGRPEEGVQEMLCELAISPGHVPARIRLAGEYLQSGDVAKARPLAEEAVSLDPKSAPARLVLGRVLAELDQLPNAIRELEAARDMSPADATTRWALAAAYARAGRQADAARERAETTRLKHR